jgi:hypothetical protein
LADAASLLLRQSGDRLLNMEIASCAYSISSLQLHRHLGSISLLAAGLLSAFVSILINGFIL